jgi:DNA repair and recombination RAD54-like protein
MRDHQRDGFEFLWKNIGASFSRDGNAIGGCVLAHPPGTGKSLLIISFLKSFMQLNTWSRALIVAPKNMILPWQDEFEKWSANINVHLMKSVKGKPSFEYLKIISEWHQTPSVLVVSYGLFSKLTDESIWSKKLEYRKIGKLLLYIPDLFVMDEGHVPRRDCSKLRKSICRVRTWGRILVSGTLFQNDVHELFNSLYLARPSFLYNLDVPYLNER